MAETHEIVLLDKKPGDAEISAAVARHFEAEAAAYDALDAGSRKRSEYVDAVDRLVVAGLGSRAPLSSLLSIACGTGRREASIRAALGRRFEIVGVDGSASMCGLAETAGLATIRSPWLDADLGARRFDAALYLHSFGLAPSRAQRVRELRKIAALLRPGAPLYLDVLNVADRDEWGPEISALFAERRLDRRGYEPGDVFYRRIGGTTVSFFHYFGLEEISGLLTEAGFLPTRPAFVGYGKRPGQLVGPEEGAIVMAATAGGG